MKKSGYGSTPSAKPSWGEKAKAETTMASNAGNSGRVIKSGSFPRNPSQKAWTGTKV